MITLCVLLCLLLLPQQVLAQFAGGGPQPGDVYKEYTFNHTTDNWRVTDPNATNPGAAAFLPNPIMHLYIDDLQDAVRAEVLIDFWGGHPGTINKQFRFNGNPWIDIPELDDLGTGPAPGEDYTQQVNHLIEIPLAHLREGDNTFRGTCGPNDWGWGQYGWYGLIVRVYYDAGKPHATGTIVSPGAGSTITDNPTIAVNTSSDAARVDITAYYDGYDTDGDGAFADFHRNYHRPSWNDDMAVRNHVGTDITSPYELQWDTTWVPDQAPGAITFRARIQDINGYWYVAPEAADITLERTGLSVLHFKPMNVPQSFWVRQGEEKSSTVHIPDLSSATSAIMHVATWNGDEWNADFYTKVNNWTVPSAYGTDHFYAYDVIDVPISALNVGDNTITFGANTAAHGPEIMWPGPSIMVRYDVRPPEIITQPADQTVMVGQSATFSVEATGTLPLSYQWRRNGSDIPGATEASYTTPVVDFPDDGDLFSCFVSNPQGHILSGTAILYVIENTSAVREDFEAYASGQDPVDWFDTTAGNSMVQNDALFHVYEIGADAVFGTTSTEANIHSHYVGAGADSLSNYIFTGRMRITAADGGIGVTFLSDYPSTDTYYRLRRFGANAFHLSPHGTSVSGVTDTGVVPVPNTWYLFKIEVLDTGSRTDIKAKVWQQGATEPSTWQIDAYDANATRITAGTIGLWGYTSGSKYWDDLTVDLLGSPQQYHLAASVVGGNGSVAPTSGTYNEGAVVTLTASPDAGYRVAAWTGTDNDTLTTDTNTVTMDDDKSVSVTFEVIPSTQYTLSVAVSGNGSTQPVAGSYNFSSGETVNLSATPDSGWTFVAWQGDVADPFAETTTVLMDANKTVTAVFAEENPVIVSDDFNACALNPFLWTLTDPLGDATVSLTGAGTGNAHLLFSIPGGANHNAYNTNMAPRLMQPAQDSDFLIEIRFDTLLTEGFQSQGVIVEQDPGNWLRFDFFHNGSNLRVYTAYTVNGATTTLLNTNISSGAPLFMRIERSGNQWTFSYSYDRVDWIVARTFNHVMTVNAVGPFVGNFDWDGNAPALTSSIDYFFNVDAPIVPEDGGPIPPTDTALDITFTGAGTVTADPDLIIYTCGDAVSLIAEPAAGWAFSRWEGDLTGSENPAVLVMDSDKIVNAVFVESSGTQYDLTAGVVGGNGTISPTSGTYDSGTVVSLTATPGTGYRVAAWTGTDNDSLTTNTNTVTMDGNKTVTVTFEPIPSAQNVLLNPSFENGTSPWRFYTSGAGSFSASSPGYDGFLSARVQIDTLGTNIQLYQFNVSLKPHTDYQLSFAAYSNTGHDVRVSLLKHVSPYTNYGLSNRWVNLTTNWNLFTIDFTTINFTTPVDDARFVFWLASDATAGDVYRIDQVVLAESGSVTEYQYAGAVAGGNGSLSPTSGTYPEGAVVTLYATPDSGYRVASWAGTDDDGLTTVTNTVTMSTDRTDITVSFEPVPDYELAASVTGGNGTVSPTGGIYPEGTVVTLVAAPDSGYRVSSWSGTDDDFLTTDTNTVTMNANRSVTVSFEPTVEYQLTAGVIGQNGAVSPTSGTYPEGAVVTLYATPDSGYRVDTWTGTDNDGLTTNTNTVTMDNDKHVTVSFVETGGAIYLNDFEFYAIGADPVDWLDTDAGNSMSENNSLFSVFDVNGNRAFGTASTLANIHSHYIGPWSGSDTSYEYTGRMRITAAGGGIGVTFFSDYPYSDTYYRLRRFYNNSFHISPHGTTISGGTTDTGVVPLPNVWYRFKVQVGDTGTRTFIRARVWQDGSSEPILWQANCFDENTTRLTSGTIGLWSFTSGSKYWDDLSVTTLSVDLDGPVVSMWYGTDLAFGHVNIGLPQRWVNILGNVTDPDGVQSLTYWVNSGPELTLTIGPNDTRLDEEGDFNAEISIFDLVDGQTGMNDVWIRALDGYGNETIQQVSVTLNDDGTVWPAGYTVDWGTVSSIQDVAQVVDGLWALEAGTIRSVEPGYDRVVAIGDMSWDDYEVTVPVTVNSIEEVYGPPGGGPTLGVIARWQGHTADGNQPHQQWWPLGSFGAYLWRQTYQRLELVDNYYRVTDNSGFQLQTGVTYIFKFRVETDVPAATCTYRLKVWPAAQTEPADWMLVGTEDMAEDQLTGSVALVSQFLDASFGAVTIVPLP